MTSRRVGPRRFFRGSRRRVAVPVVYCLGLVARCVAAGEHFPACRCRLEAGHFGACG